MAACQGGKLDPPTGKECIRGVDPPLRPRRDRVPFIARCPPLFESGARYRSSGADALKYLFADLMHWTSTAAAHRARACDL